MKNPIKHIIFAALAWAGTTTANPLSNLAVEHSNQKLQTYLQAHANDSSWFGYSIPAPPETGQICCYQHKGEAGCDLNIQNNGFSTFKEQGHTQNIHFFMQQSDGQLQRIVAVGDQCPVKAEGRTVTWLDAVAPVDSTNWLGAEMLKVKDDSSGAMMALSFHAQPLAATKLYETAKMPDRKRAEQATFWLGQRQHDGFSYLKKLLTELSPGKVRQSLNFALSQNHNEEAAKLLKQIAQHDADKQQQAEAIFWLSQGHDTEELPAFLLQLIDQNQDPTILEKAIFSLSQLHSDWANRALADLVDQHPKAKVREQALFWLAQNDTKLAKASAQSVIDSTQRSSHEKEQAVFALSQLPGKQSEQALFELIQGNHSKAIKKQALFWLSQSDDEATISRLSELL